MLVYIAHPTNNDELSLLDPCSLDRATIIPLNQQQSHDVALAIEKSFLANAFLMMNDTLH